MKFPAEAYSQLGPIPIAYVSNLLVNDKPAFGCIGYDSRKIYIETVDSEVVRLSTLYHELVHLALWDAGAQNLLDENTAEAVCDAIGTYLAAATLAGYIKLPAKRPST